MPKLTEKQKRFIDYYIELGNAREAAVKAGYSKKTANVIGCENLTKLNDFIQEKIRDKDAERIASQDEVLRFLTSVMRQEAKEEVIIIEEGYASYKTKTASLREATKAAELLGKRYGIDKPGGQSESDTVKIILERRSHDDGNNS